MTEHFPSAQNFGQNVNIILWKQNNISFEKVKDDSLGNATSEKATQISQAPDLLMSDFKATCCEIKKTLLDDYVTIDMTQTPPRPWCMAQKDVM
jgi:hypothetical protein